MLGVGKRTAEEFYSRCQSNTLALAQAARQHADAGDAVAALAAAWGADVSATEAVLWERILIASRTPQRQFFRGAEALVSALQDAEIQDVADLSVRDVIGTGRAGLLAGCDPELRRGIEAAWPDVSYLDQLAAPTEADFVASVATRLGGPDPEAFVAHRRGEAAQAMATAQALRIKGELDDAIQNAYASDFLALEAYLVESATAAGDSNLLTVVIRWDLAVAGVSQLADLPAGFVPAVTRIREAICSGLGEADAGRLASSLVAL